MNKTTTTREKTIEFANGNKIYNIKILVNPSLIGKEKSVAFEKKLECFLSNIDKSYGTAVIHFNINTYTEMKKINKKKEK